MRKKKRRFLKFKKKWLSDDVRTERLGEIINGKVEALREELLKMIGVVGFNYEDT